MSGIVIRFVHTSVLVLLILSKTNGQPTWRVYTAPNKSFSVDLPWKPINRSRVMRDLVPGTGSPFKGSTVDDWYDLSMYIDESSTRFFIHVYEVPFRRSQDEFDNEVRQIMRVDTCKSCTFFKNESIVVNGLMGREFIYQRDKVSGRILFINGGHRLYSVGFSTEDKKGISRGPVARVFSSFQPTP